MILVKLAIILIFVCQPVIQNVCCANYYLIVTPVIQDVAKGNEAFFTIRVFPVAGYLAPVQLSVDPIPNLLLSLNTSSVIPGNTATLSVKTNLSTEIKTYQIRIVADGGLVISTCLLNVTNAKTFFLIASPQNQTIRAGTSCSILITSQPMNSFTGSINLQCIGNPPNTTTRFSPAIITESQSSNLILTVASSTSPGFYNLQIKGYSGELTQTTTYSFLISNTLPSQMVVPSPPPNVSARIVNHVPLISWDWPENDGGSQITQFILNKGDSPSSFYYTTTISSDNTYYIDYNVLQGSTYYYSVSAVNSSGQSIFTQAISIIIEDVVITPGVPTPPRSLIGTLIVNQIKLTWLPPSNDGGQPVTSWKIFKKSNIDKDYYALLQMANVGVYEYIDTLISSGVTYNYYITAINQNGESEKSSIVSIPVNPVKQKPSPPRNLSAYYYNGSVNLYWMQPENDGGSQISHYYIFRSKDNNYWYNEKVVDSWSSYYVDQRVEKGIKYYYKVAAQNETGLSDYSNITEVFTSADDPYPIEKPWPPQNLEAFLVDGKVFLRWLPPSNNETNPTKSYVLYRGYASGFYSSSFETTQTNFNDYTVVKDNTYCYVVIAKNDKGSSEYSNEVTITVLNGQPPITMQKPEPPVGLNGSYKDGFVTLRWQPPPFDGNSPVLFWNVYRIGKDDYYPSKIGTLVNNGVLEYKDTTVQRGKDYLYTVTAVNSIGESEKSIGYSVSVMDQLDRSPRNFRLATFGKCPVLTWDPPEYTSGLVYYVVWRSENNEPMKPIVVLNPDRTLFLDEQVFDNFQYKYLLVTIFAEYSLVISKYTLTYP